MPTSALRSLHLPLRKRRGRCFLYTLFMEKILFLNMFSNYEPPEALGAALSQAAIVAADIDAPARMVTVRLASDIYIPQKFIAQASKDICEVYGLRKLGINVQYPASELQKIPAEDLMNLFVAQNSMSRASLAGASWNWEGNRLTVQLPANGKKELEECVPKVKLELKEQFGADVEVSILPGKDLAGQALFDAMDKMRSTILSDLPRAVQIQKKDQASAAAAQQQSETFYGKPFKGNTVAMKDLTLDMGSVIVEGKVFAVEHKELKKRNAWVVNFDMTDNTGSVRINRFMEANEAKPILDNVAVGKVLRVQGKLMINQFDNELILKPFSMMPGSLPKRQDKAEGDKRVELHLHTSMSNLDALTSTKDAIKQAAAWGHKAIAITDHG